MTSPAPSPPAKSPPTTAVALPPHLQPPAASESAHHGHANAARTPRLARWVGAAIGLLWLKILVVTAWQGDDAFITHRTAANLVDGLGAVWNAGERVQSYTHPLWFAFSAVCHVFFGEAFVSLLVVSMALMAITVAGVALGAAKDWRRGAALALALSCSSAVTDYGVSGLENPLLFVLLLAALLATTRLPMPREITAAALLISAVGLTRMDALVMAGPPLLVMASGLQARKQALRALIIGGLPFLAWELFSLWYYGIPVPNTAIAKLNLHIDGVELARQGLRYLAWTARRDPMTLALIAAGVASAVRWGGRVERASAVGVGLYLLYIVRIGGDFMGGRFLAAPAVLGAVLVARTAPARLPLPAGLPAWPALAAAACVLWGLAWPHSPWRTDSDYGVGRDMASVVAASGVADERAYYQPTTGLLRNLRAWRQLRAADEPIPPYPMARRGWRVRHKRGVVTQNEVGFYGYFAGPGTYVVDVWALCDPLLARLPFEPGARWRVGHYPRPLPAGYLESLRSGRNLLRDPGLHALYDDIRLATRAPLFAPERFGAIWRLNTGHHSEATRLAAAPRGENR